jgi:hypothetical protein
MRVYIISIVCILLLNTKLLYTQSWPKYYGQQNRPDYSKALIESYDNGFLICGDYFSNDYTKRWASIIKADINGNVIWNKILENSLEYVNPNSIAQTQDGGFVLCGNVTLIENVIYPLIAKFNACGEKEWCKVFTGSQTPLPSARDIKVTESGEIVVLVNQFGSYPAETLHLFKLSANGEVLWQEPFATTYNHPNSHMKIGQSLMITSNGKYLISGYGYWRDPWNPQGAFAIRHFFAMADGDGNEEWVLPFGLNDTILGKALDVIEINDTLFMGIGAFIDYDATKPSFLFFNDNGQELMFRYFENHQIDSGFYAGAFNKVKMLDSLIFAGGSFSFNPDHQVIVDCILNLDIDELTLEPEIIKLSNNNLYPYLNGVTHDNKLLSSSTYRHSSNNYDIFLAKLNLNLEYDTAYSGNFTYDSLCIPGPPQSGFIYLNDCDIVLGTEMPTAEDYWERKQHIPITIYPNPAKDHITFALENTEHHRNIEMRCFNLLGMLQHQTKILRSQQQTSANVSAWPPGMYVVVVYSDSRPVGRGKFVVQK